MTLHPTGHSYDARFRIRKHDGTFGVTLSFSIIVSIGSDGMGPMFPGTLLDYLRSLAILQTRTPTPIVSDPQSSSDAGDPEGQEMSLANHYKLYMLEPSIVRVGEQEFTLGTVQRKLLSARVETEEGGLRARPCRDDTAHRVFRPDHIVPDPSKKRRVVGEDLGPIEDASGAG